MFSRPKILFLVSLLFVALLNSIPTYLLNFQFFYQSYIIRITKLYNYDMNFNKQCIKHKQLAGLVGSVASFT